MDKQKAWIIDIETYPNCFLFAVERADGKYLQVFEISHRMNQIDRVLKCMKYLEKSGEYMVSFNGIGFDYPILHTVHKKRRSLPEKGVDCAKFVFELAQAQIDSFRGDGFGNIIRSDDILFKQLDLYRIWHFNNKARATSLKLLEFNMRMKNIEDLPFPVGSILTDEQIEKLKNYVSHDISATRLFFDVSQEQIDFRLALSEKYERDWNNFDDTKIGAEYFALKLEQSGVKTREYLNGKLVMRQTKRKNIDISECLYSYYDFKRPEFVAVFDWFRSQVIDETKGVFSDIEEHDLGEVAKYAVMVVKRRRFKGIPDQETINQFKTEHPMGWVEIEELKALTDALDSNGNPIMEYQLDKDGCPDLKKKQKKKKVPKKSYWGCYRIAETLNVVVDGFRFDFGTGGIHGSIESKIATANAAYELVDADVSSMYPNLAISNRVYPEHLGEKFCDIYEEMYIERKSYPKGSAENGMLKLALNGTYGKSNDQYSIFYDPKFTMTITINGQLSLCLLAEKLLQIPKLKIVQVNTDGVTVALPRKYRAEYDKICEEWQQQVKLQLEFAEYSQMIIRDVNNYIAVYTNGKLKRKGAYQYEGLGYHQNQGGLIIPMAAEAEMLKGIPARKFIEDHLKNPDNKWDFLLRTKVPRSSHLMLVFPDGTEVKQQNVCRYYISNAGGNLVKVMPPLEGDTEHRKLGIDVGWNVTTCNEVPDDLTDVCLEYYVSEAEKLIIRKD